MTEWSWKQAVADRLLRIVNERETTQVSIDDLYAFKSDFAIQFPNNRHIREKIRQTVQRLRDDGLLNFEGAGVYAVNLGFEDLTGDPVDSLHEGFVLPRTTVVVRTLRLRCTLLATEIKRRYFNTCQLCSVPVKLSSEQFYAEAHHLRPLGAPHLGPDTPGNIIVLCPNHHVMFDKAVVTISPEDYAITHAVPDAIPIGARLRLAAWHSIDMSCLSYHNGIARSAG